VKHGGKREGAGRPPVPDEDRMAATVVTRVTKQQLDSLNELYEMGYSTRDILLAGAAYLQRKKQRRAVIR
jgi:hypothetical protein